MFFAGGLVGLVLLGLWVYCIVDVISTDEAVIRNLPKILWLFIVIFLPTIGSIVWLLLGRPEKASFAPGGSAYRPEPQSGQGRWRQPSRAVLAPDDDPQFLAQLDDSVKRLRSWEEDLRRREEELRKRDEGDERSDG